MTSYFVVRLKTGCFGMHTQGKSAYCKDVWGFRNKTAHLKDAPMPESV